MAASIFISYASQDHGTARTICEALEHRGFACWIASRDIPPGENFQVAIVRAIRSAKVMIMVFTANSNNSEEIKKELVLAGQSRLVVIPVRVEDVKPDEAFAYEFATRQWVDAFDDWERSMQLLVRQLSSVAGVAEAGRSVSAEPERPAPQRTAVAADAMAGDRTAAAPLAPSRPARRLTLGLIAVAALVAAAASVWWWIGQPSKIAPRPRAAGTPAASPSAAPAAAARAFVATPKTATLRAELAARLALAVPRMDEKTREDRARDYEAALSHKAQAASPEPPGTWRSSAWPSAAEAETAALEQCQIFHGQPCVLLAVDDAMPALPKDGSWPRRDMPRARYAGLFDPSEIPGAGFGGRERTDIVYYRLAAGPKAAAYHPRGGRLFTISAAASQRTAEEDALKACNGDPNRNGADGACFLYAVGDQVVLPRRAREPLTAAGSAASKP